MNEILWVSKENFACTRELYEEVFPEDSKEFVDYYYREKSMDSEGLIMRRICDGKILSMLHCNPYEVVLPRGRGADYAWGTMWKTVYYIVAVATKEEERKKGYMGKLMEQALLSAYAKNHPFIFLMPVSEALYAPYGFTYIYSKCEEQINRNIITSDILMSLEQKRKPMLLMAKGKKNLWLSALGMEYLAWQKDLKEAPKELRAASNIEENDIGQLVNFAKEELGNSKNVYVHRTKAYYLRLQQELQSQGGDIYLLWEENHLIGYFIYTEESKGLLQEIILENSFYRDKLIEHNKNTPVIMARVVNLSSMGEHIFTEEESVCHSIWIRDPIIVENNGLFLWKIEKAGSTFTKIEEKESKGLILDTTIDLLTAFCLGYKKPEECFREIRDYEKVPIKLELQKALQELKRPDTPFFNELV